MDVLPIPKNRAAFTVVALSLVLAGPAKGQTAPNPYNGFGWLQAGNTIQICSYSGSSGAVTMPITILVNGANLPVTSIGDQAFGGWSSLTSVTIGNNVTNIGHLAFYDCTSLTNVTIPDSITSIQSDAFYNCTSLTGVTIPDSVISIGNSAFEYCTRLTDVTIGNSLTSIGAGVFYHCTSLTNVTIGNNVTNIVEYAFYDCTSLTHVVLPDSVSSIGAEAFYNCTSLRGIYFKGNAPSADSTVFAYDTNATFYYVPRFTGWTSRFARIPTALWFLPNPLIVNSGPSFGVLTNRFGFIISWATNTSVVVEGCTNLAQPAWSPVGTNTLSGGSSYFSDPQWTNYPSRFYRLRSQ